MTTRPIVIDTDPGQDDAVALLLALASPELEVLAVTAVAGNVPLHLTERNARMICELAGRPDVPVYAGCARPMVRPLVTAEYVHGASGIDGADLPEPTVQLADGHAVDALVDLLRSAGPEGITLCALGPLTNLALAIVKEPSITAGIRQVVMMGGGFFEGGNRTPAAEFNVYVDPHAAHVVLDAGVDVVMLPLDVTHQALVTPPRLARFRELGTPVGDAVAGMLEFFERFDVDKYGSEGGPLHDPCVIAYLLRPDLFEGRRCHVAIETGSERTMGMTVVDWWGVTGVAPTALVANRVDANGLFDLIVERLARL